MDSQTLIQRYLLGDLTEDEVAELDRLYSETTHPADPASVVGYTRRFAALSAKNVDDFIARRPVRR